MTTALQLGPQKARIQARKYKAAPINISKLEQEIPRIREMTVKNPEEFCGNLTDLFAECGIKLWCSYPTLADLFCMEHHFMMATTLLWG